MRKLSDWITNMGLIEWYFWWCIIIGTTIIVAAYVFDWWV